MSLEGVNFEAPRVVGSLDPTVFMRLSEKYGAVTKQIDWDVINNRPGNCMQAGTTLEPLEPLVEMLVVDHPGIAKAKMIRMDIDLQKVKHGKTQRGFRWHTDGRLSKDAPSYIVASSLTTEFVAFDPRQNPELTEIMETHARIQSDGGGLSYPDELFTGIEVPVFRPKPYEVVEFQNRVHRSPVNPRWRSVSRGFIRASFFHG